MRPGIGCAGRTSESSWTMTRSPSSNPFWTSWPLASTPTFALLVLTGTNSRNARANTRDKRPRTGNQRPGTRDQGPRTMDQGLRNKLRNVVTQCRKLLEESVSQGLQGKFGIHANPRRDEVVIEDMARMTNLTDEEKAYRNDLIEHYEHIKAFGPKAKDALSQLIREIAFTHLNRLCAYKMMEAREVYVQGQKFREAVSRGLDSNGVKFYLAEHPDDERRFNTGQQDIAYRHFLNWLGGQLSEEIGVLFSPNDPANRLYPRQKTLDDVLALINDEELAGIWSQDETIGWVYQYFTPKELRDQARRESQAPRNSYELAFRNQFFTPRYVVEFLTDNTLGRIWYEMRKGETKLKDQCRYMVRRPSEVFLPKGSVVPGPSSLEADTNGQGQTPQAAGVHSASPQERPPRDQDPRPGLRQRALPALLLRFAAGHLRGSLRRPRSGVGTAGRLPHEGRPAEGSTRPDPAA